MTIFILVLILGLVAVLVIQSIQIRILEIKSKALDRRLQSLEDSEQDILLKELKTRTMWD